MSSADSKSGKNYMSDAEDRNSPLPESPGGDEFLITDDTKISEEDRNEILSQIETVVEKNQIPITDELFKLHPKKKGVMFPVLLNIITLLLVAGGVLFMFRFFQARQESLSMETQAYLSTEGKLIEELRKETEEALSAKEQEIYKIQNELAELDRQSRDLQQNMEESIRMREEELREELEAELAAEQERLQGEGVSQQEIEARLEALEARRGEEFNRQIAEYRDEAQAELAQKEAELTEARKMAEQILEQANEERARLAEETRQREAELRRQFEEEREALESRSSEAETKLRELAEIREREILINDQIIGSYAEIIDDIQAGNVEAAGNSLEELKRFIQDPAIQTLPSIANRKNVELFIINNMKETLDTKAGGGGAETKSLLEAANLVVTARSLAARADEAAQAGDAGEAKRLYTQALEAVPVLNRAFRSIRNIEENQTAGAIRGIVDEARRILEEGNREEALQLFRQAALMSAGVNEQLAADAVTGLERVYSLENRDDVREREQEIIQLEAAVEELENTIDEQAEAIALRENIVARRDETIEEQLQRIAEHEREGENLQARIEEQENELGALREGLKEVEKLAAENTELQALTDTMKEKDGEIAELRKQLASLSERGEVRQGEISGADASRLAVEAKETAYQEILDFVGYLLGDKPSRFKREVEEKADTDVMYRNIIESIQELAESTVAPEELVATVEMKLIGTIASVTAGRVVIESLLNIPVPEGSRILIKRRTSSGEVPIADGEVYDVAAGRISAKIIDRISATRSPMVMDLVYMEVEQ
jgi:hypothetical protein